MVVVGRSVVVVVVVLLLLLSSSSSFSPPPPLPPAWQADSALVYEEACASEVCRTIGYIDDWQQMDTFKRAKAFLSLCVCIQLLKIIKFISALVPKMDLAPTVLKKALPDLFFFGVVFAISLLAFSSMFYIQLGSVMVDFNDQIASFISLGRALFGDFSIDEARTPRPPTPPRPA